MGVQDEAELIEPASLADWHRWLAEHHARGSGVWVVTRRSGDRLPYEDLVLEALCWGWIDSTVKTVDDERAKQWFSPRSARSMWVASNKRRVALLQEQGRMQPAGQTMIDAAHTNGMWTLMDDVEALIEPADLATALDADPTARACWDAIPPSGRKQAMTQVVLARRAETRARRVADVVSACSDGRRPV